MAVSVNDLREYLVDPPESDAFLQRFLDAAKSKARDADIPDFKNNAHYDLFILSLAGMFYENRGMGFAGSYKATSEETAMKMINSFVLALRNATEDPVATEEAVADG